MRTVRFLENLRTEQFGFGSGSYRKNRACSTLVAAPPSLLHPAVAAHPGRGRRVPRRCSLGGVRRRRASSPTGRRGVRRHRASPPAVHPPLQGTRDGWSRRRTGREGGGRGRGRAPPRRDSEREGGRLGRGGAPPAAAPRGRETGPGQGRHRAGREEDGVGQGAAAPGLRGGGKLPCRDEGGAGRGGWDWGGALVRAL